MGKFKKWQPFTTNQLLVVISTQGGTTPHQSAEVATESFAPDLMMVTQLKIALRRKKKAHAPS